MCTRWQNKGINQIENKFRIEIRLCSSISDQCGQMKVDNKMFTREPEICEEKKYDGKSKSRT